MVISIQYFRNPDNEGFSQGGLAVVELLKYIDDETYSQLAGDGEPGRA